ncbi:DEAD/DEAH box helicase family protein [Archangium sp.]|uniref:DEAD/DEAH box helicase family protein n=1 Tax=Archangium sp. TaxID=1872627 RepID=UPI00389A6136
MSPVLFLNEKRLLDGPWQALERDVARLMVANGFDDVRIVGGSGDRGADVVGVLSGQVWVFQCKHTTTRPPPVAAIREVMEAGKVYGAHRLVVATSRPPGEGLLAERRRLAKLNLNVEIADPPILLGMMSNTPEYSPHRRELRPYQADVVERFHRSLVDTGRGQVVLATGLGKTVIMAQTVVDLLTDGALPNGRVLVLAHTRNLVDQLEHAFWFQLPKWVPTHRLMEGELPSFWDGITFATVQSALAKVDELPDFDLILVDEAHHIGAAMFRRVIEQLRSPKLGGATATPWRGDGYDIDELLGPALVKLGIADGLREGFLADVDYRLLADNLDWKVVQGMSRHRYSIRDLNRHLIIPLRDEEAARTIRQVFHEERRRSVIVFSPTIVHATAFAGMLRHFGFRAEAISSEMDARERDLVMTRFRAGQLDAVTTVDLFNEGVDVPDVDMLVFMRVTHSRRIFVQQLGRGLRLSPGKKKVVVLDVVTDLRRVAEVLDLDKSVRGEDVERLGLGGRVVQLRDASAGSFLKEWMLDQASLFLREEDSDLELPDFDFPRPVAPGGVQ